MRRATLTLRNPVPMGVVSGPLIATPLLRMESSTWSGRGVPYLSMTSAPASWTSQSNSTPVPSRDPAGGLRQLRSYPVPGDERDTMGHGEALLCSRCRQGYLCTADGRGKPLRLVVDPPPETTGGTPRWLTQRARDSEAWSPPRTRISDVDGQQGKLWYAGYDIVDPAAHATFEETIHLLHHLAADGGPAGGDGGHAAGRERPGAAAGRPGRLPGRADRSHDDPADGRRLPPPSTPTTTRPRPTSARPTG